MTKNGTCFKIIGKFYRAHIGRELLNIRVVIQWYDIQLVIALSSKIILSSMIKPGVGNR